MKYAFCIFLHLSTWNPLDRSLKSTSDTVENWMNSTQERSEVMRGERRWKSSGIIWKHMKSIIIVLSACISCILSSLLFEVGCCPGFTVPIQIPKVSQPQWITSSCVRTCKLMTKIIAWHLQVLWGSWSQGWEMMGLEWRNESTKEGVETSRIGLNGIHMSRGTVQMMTEALTQKGKGTCQKRVVFLAKYTVLTAAVLLSVLPPCRDLKSVKLCEQAWQLT